MYPNRLTKFILVDVAGILQKTAFIKQITRLPVNEKNIPQPFKSITAQVNDFGSTLIEMTSIKVSEAIEQSALSWYFLQDSSNINAALSLVEEDFSPALAEVPVATEIIWGELDNVAPLRTAKVLEKHLKQARLHVIASAGHVAL